MKRPTYVPSNVKFQVYADGSPIYGGNGHLDYKTEELSVRSEGSSEPKFAKYLIDPVLAPDDDRPVRGHQRITLPKLVQHLAWVSREVQKNKEGCPRVSLSLDNIDIGLLATDPKS